MAHITKKFKKRSSEKMKKIIIFLEFFVDYAQEGNCRKINFLLKQLDYIHERLELIFACGNCLLRRYLISKVGGFSYF
jgi:hypothetical protein